MGMSEEELCERICQLEKELKEEKEIYNNLLEKYNKLVCCHLQYEEMTGVDLLLPEKINYISKDKIRDLIAERKFELQQEYEDFENDIKLKILEELLGD